MSSEGHGTDTESNVSGIIRYSDNNIKDLYISIINNMESINQNILKIEKNMNNLIEQAGPMEGQLSALLHSLPKPNVSLPMESDQ